jgi:MinD-like ATPase involved in chromosome partitioning or flagellar assembly
MDAIRQAGGSLAPARVLMVGDPNGSAPGASWHSLAARLGAIPVADMEQLAVELARDPEELRRASDAEQRAMRPGAPEAAAWRDALRAARPGRFARFARKRRPVEGRAGERELDALIRRELTPGCHSIAVISPKGGVGKTLISFLLGATLARVRGDRVLAIDTNPDFGTLADLVPERVPATISDLLRDIQYVRTDEDAAAYTTATRSGLQILAAPQDPTEMGRLGKDGYRTVSDLIARYYDLVIYDCGTGFLDEITQFALNRADQVVLVTVPQLVTTKIVMGAADHLATLHFNPQHCTLALNQLRGRESLDRRRLHTALSGHVGGIVDIPYDLRLQRDLDLGEYDDPRVAPATRQAMKRLAAEIIGRMPPAAAHGRDGEDAHERQGDDDVSAELDAGEGSSSAIPIEGREHAASARGTHGR